MNHAWASRCYVMVLGKPTASRMLTVSWWEISTSTRTSSITWPVAETTANPSSGTYARRANLWKSWLITLTGMSFHDLYTNLHKFKFLSGRISSNFLTSACKHSTLLYRYVTLLYCLARVWSIRYNHFHDQLVLTSSSDSRVILTNAASISSEPFGHLVEDDDDDDDAKDR